MATYPHAMSLNIFLEISFRVINCSYTDKKFE